MEKRMAGCFGYEDMIELPRHVSAVHPAMDISERAAQFSAFAALTGYEEAVQETERLTEERVELDEEVKYAINEKLLALKTRLAESGKSQETAITYFVPDERKSGGAYVTVTGAVKKIDAYRQVAVMEDGSRIPIDDIVGITI